MAKIESRDSGTAVFLSPAIETISVGKLSMGVLSFCVFSLSGGHVHSSNGKQRMERGKYASISCLQVKPFLEQKFS